MTVGIDFCIANSRAQAARNIDCVKFDEKLHHYLLGREGFPPNRFRLLLNLDQYGDRLFSSKEISQLVRICENLQDEYSHMKNVQRNGGEMEKEIYVFAEELKSLCVEALAQNKKVHAAGD